MDAPVLALSQARRWVNCPGSVLLSDLGTPAPEQDVTVRDEGNAFHWAAYQIFYNMSHIEPGETRAPNGTLIDKTMFAHLHEYINGLPSGMGMMERNIHAFKSIHPQAYGRIDYLNISKGVIDIIDAKYGYRWVDPFMNWQLISYGAAILDELDIDDQAIQFRFAIYQPRAFRSEGPWHYWTVNAHELRAQINQLAMAAERAFSNDAQCITGWHCSNCSKRIVCNAFWAASENALEASSEQAAVDASPLQTDRMLLRIERALSILEAQKTALEARAEMHIRKGAQLDHFGMVSHNGRTAWKSSITVEQLKAIGATTGATLTKESAITPTQARGLIPDDIIDALSESSSGSPKLTRLSPNYAARVFSKR